MRPGYVRKDSISKCATDDHLYSTIRNPAVRKIAPKSVDTIESAQAKLENNALQRLKMMHLPSETMIIVARAGKFVFLAIVLPPYVALYAIPKWLLMDAMPFFIHFTFKSLKLSNQKLKKTFNPTKNLSNTFKSIYSAIKTRAAEYIHWINSVSKSLFVHLKHKVVVSAYKVLEPIIKPFLSSGYQAAKKTAALLHIKTGSQVDVAAKFVKFTAQTIKNEVVNHFRPFAEIISKKYSQIKQFGAHHINNTFVRLQKFNKILKENVRKITKSAEAEIQKFTKTITAPLYSLVIKPAQHLIQQSIKYVQQANVVLQANLIKVKSFVNPIIRHASDISKSISTFTINFVKQIFETISLTSLKQFFSGEKGFKENFKKLKDRLSEKTKRASKYIISLLDMGYKNSISSWNAFILWLKKIIYKLLLEIKMLPRRSIKLGSNFLTWVKTTYSKLKNTYSTLSFWTRVFFRYSWEEVLVLSSTLSSSIKYKK